MTTTTAHTSTTEGLAPRSATTRPPVDISGDKVPFVRLVGLEVRKMVDTRAGMWMLTVMAGISFLITAMFLILGDGAGDRPFSGLLEMTVAPFMILLPVMGIMSATQEWSHRTGLSTFTLVPRRGRLVAAKSAAALVLTLVLLLVAVAAAALGTVIGGGEFTMEGISAGGLVLLSLIYTLQGVAFGAAFLSTPLAIVAVLALPTVWTILTSMITRVQDVAPWLDLNMVTQPLMTGDMAGKDWAQLATASVAWVLLPLAIGSYRILTREVK